MAEYKINENKNEIVFEGAYFKLSEIKTILKKSNVELFRAITCPGEIKYALSEEAKSLMRQIKKDKNASG